jgi:alkylation response protein AidB-like acyl-CoA dehydrogenase
VGRPGYDFERRRGIEAKGGFSREAWDELAELGLTGLYIAEDDGGMAMGPVAGMVVMEELGRGIVLEPFAQTLVAGACSAATPTRAPRKTGCRRSPAARRIVVLAYQERKARYRLDVCEAQATPARHGWSLNGDKSVVPVGDQADAFLVPGQGGRQDRPVPGRAQRSGVKPAATAPGRRPRGRSGVREADATLVTADGLAALEHAVDIGIACTCAEAVGVMDKTDAAHRRIHEHAQAVRRDAGHLPGAAPSHGRHEDAAGTGALHELLRLAQAQRAGRGTAPRDGARQVPAGRVDALRRPRTRCSCTAASA